MLAQLRPTARAGFTLQFFIVYFVFFSVSIQVVEQLSRKKKSTELLVEEGKSIKQVVCLFSIPLINRCSVMYTFIRLQTEYNRIQIEQYSKECTVKE